MGRRLSGAKSHRFGLRSSGYTHRDILGIRYSSPSHGLETYNRSSCMGHSLLDPGGLLNPLARANPEDLLILEVLAIPLGLEGLRETQDFPWAVLALAQPLQRES